MGLLIFAFIIFSLILHSQKRIWLAASSIPFNSEYCTNTARLPRRCEKAPDSFLSSHKSGHSVRNRT